MIGIYKIENKINHRIYIGQSIHLEVRLNEHKRSKDKSLIDNDIKKLGKENFSFDIIEECDPEDLDEFESYYIEKYNSLVPNGYNIAKFGTSSYGENNPGSVLTEKEVISLRKIYSDKKYTSLKSIWENGYKDKITINNFRAVFTGKYWEFVMPEVFNKENREYYLKIKEQNRRTSNQYGEDNCMATLTEKDVIKIRVLYTVWERKRIFNEFNNFSQRLITSIISGQNWKQLPIYQKRKKQWIYPDNWTELQNKEFEKIKEEILNGK